MWNPLKALFPKPTTPEERLWKLVTRGLTSDAKLLASGLDACGRPAAGSWSLALIECEICALRGWVACAKLSGGQQAEGEKLIQSFEERLRERLSQKHAKSLTAFCILSQTSLSEQITLLSEGWRHYDAVVHFPDTSTPEMMADLCALFWGRCVEGYTHKKIDAFLDEGESVIDHFIPRYVAAQIQLARAAA